MVTERGLDLHKYIIKISNPIILLKALQSIVEHWNHKKKLGTISTLYESFKDSYKLLTHQKCYKRLELL